MASTPTPGACEFPSVVSLIEGNEVEQHDAVFCCYVNFQHSVRTRQYKLIVYSKAGVRQLFNIVKDSWETADLSADPKHAALGVQLLQGLRRFQRELGDDVCKPGRNRKQENL